MSPVSVVEGPGSILSSGDLVVTFKLQDLNAIVNSGVLPSLGFAAPFYAAPPLLPGTGVVPPISPTFTSVAAGRSPGSDLSYNGLVFPMEVIPANIYNPHKEFRGYGVVSVTATGPAVNIRAVADKAAATAAQRFNLVPGKTIFAQALYDSRYPRGQTTTLYIGITTVFPANPLEDAASCSMSKRFVQLMNAEDFAPSLAKEIGEPLVSATGPAKGIVKFCIDVPYDLAKTPNVCYECTADEAVSNVAGGALSEQARLGLIVGLTVGGAALVIGGLVAWWIVRKRRAAKQGNLVAGNPDVGGKTAE